MDWHSANRTITFHTSASGTDAQVVCVNSAITTIIYALGNDVTGASLTAGSD